jgi:hypothetical protein
VLYAVGGIDFAWAVDGGITGEGVDIPAEDFLVNTDLAAVFGVGLEFPVGGNAITAELRYRQGLLNSANQDALTAEGSLPVRFRFAGIQLTAGILFGGGGRP